MSIKNSDTGPVRFRTRVPLGLKLGAWLMLNLILLATIGIIALVAAFGLRWEAFIAGGAGSRLRALFTNVVTDLRFVRESERAAFLESRGRDLGLDLILIRHDKGDILSTSPIRLPPKVLQQIQGPLSEPPPPPFHPAAPARLDFPSAFALQDRLVQRPIGRSIGPIFITFTGTPAPFWIGIRTHVEAADRMSIQPALLLIRVPSIWALTRVFDFMLWVWMGLSALGISILFWWPMVRGLNRSIRTLAHATERVADGHFNTRVAIERRDELGVLGQSVNRMTQRLDRLVAGHRRFLSDAAHELNSPLGRLQMAVTLLEERAQPEQRSSINDVREEVQVMSKLVEELLVYSRASGGRQAALSAVNPAEVLRSALTREDRAQRVTLECEEGLRALADLRLVERALSNLVRNALRYAPEGNIAVTAHATPTEVIVRVDDEGPGVPPEFIERLGEPFFRPDDARTREAGGTGLGLAIVKAAVNASEGRVTFANRVPRGFRAEVALKRAPDARS